MKPTKKYYPNLLQSLGLMIILICSVMIFRPLLSKLISLYGEETALLVFYVISFGIPVLIAHQLRKTFSGLGSYTLLVPSHLEMLLISFGSTALLFSIVAPIGNIISVPDAFKELMMTYSEYKGVSMIILMVVAAPILEEIFFRGIILDGLLKNHSPTLAIFLSSLLFGLGHMNPFQLITGLVLGGFLGWVYYRTHNLLACILMHSIINFVGFLGRNAATSYGNIDAFLLDQFGNVSNIVMALAISIIVFITCVYLLHKQFNKKAYQ